MFHNQPSDFTIRVKLVFRLVIAYPNLTLNIPQNHLILGVEHRDRYCLVAVNCKMSKPG